MQAHLQGDASQRLRAVAAVLANDTSAIVALKCALPTLTVRMDCLSVYKCYGVLLMLHSLANAEQRTALRHSTHHIAHQFAEHFAFVRPGADCVIGVQRLASPVQKTWMARSTPAMAHGTKGALCSK